MITEIDVTRVNVRSCPSHTVSVESEYTVDITQGEAVVREAVCDVIVQIFWGSTWSNDDRAWFWSRSNCPVISEGPFETVEKAKDNARKTGAIPSWLADQLRLLDIAN